MEKLNSKRLKYYLGCPQWTHKPWMGQVYPAHLSGKSELFYYSQIFNTVEGNTSFYATPAKETLQKWANDVRPDFRYLFKVHQQITHEQALEGLAVPLFFEWLDRFSILEQKLGTILIQLPSRIRYQDLDRLWRFLDQILKNRYPCTYAVELRDLQCFVPEHLSRINDMLCGFQVEHTVMDTRPLRAIAPINQAVSVAQERKPNMPVFPIGLGPCPVIRYVAHPHVEDNVPWLCAWADRFVDWLQLGKTPYFFAHYPGEDLAPVVARRFHEILAEKLSPFDLSIGEAPKFFGTTQLPLFE
jgi:uncharacterized protein YecE (DUF72 family)